MSRAGLLLVVALVCSGCVAADGPDFVRDFEGPSDEFWKVAAENPTAEGSSLGIFLLPFWISADETKVSADGTAAQSTSISTFNPGLGPLPTLPFWITVNDERFTADGEHMENGFIWTPFYAGTTLENWPDDEPRWSASGIPLLYSSIRHGWAPDYDDTSIHQFLWTLGPLYASFDSGGDREFLPDGFSGYAFIPLFGGMLGSWLWSSSDYDIAGDRMVAHGPLSGYLGYLRRRNYDIPVETEDRLTKIEQGVESSETTLVIGGVLWSNFEDINAAGEVVDARYGPLWGMLGWGRSDGEPCIRLFWFPIGV